MKRTLDLIFSAIALLVFSLPIILIISCIKVFYKHPIFFKQIRIGLNKQPFKILKFQTLVDGKPTKCGAILRRTGLDELAQFINVAKGEMSIVGPRALTEYDIVRLGWDSHFYNKRWDVKPGISGLAQLYGGQSKKTSWFWDQKYLDKNTLALDVLIILISFLMNLFGKRKIRQSIWNNKTMK